MITYPSTDVSKDFTCPNVNGIITCKYFEVNNSKLNTYSFKFKAVSLTLNPFWTGTNYLTVACAAQATILTAPALTNQTVHLR